jgi:hypothetical protein
MDLENKGVYNYDQSVQEKFNGRFKLRINKNLPMPTKIEKYANE